LQHRAADMRSAVEQARALALIAAARVDSPDPSERRRAASAAKAMAALAGEIHFLTSGGVANVNANMAGADFVGLTATLNTFVFKIISRPEIKDPGAQRQEVGISALAEWAMRRFVSRSTAGDWCRTKTWRSSGGRREEAAGAPEQGGGCCGIEPIASAPSNRVLRCSSI
jgi:hypothetical protein